MLFVQNLWRQLNMDKKDMFAFFIGLRAKHTIDEINEIFDNDNYDISKLDINRM